LTPATDRSPARVLYIGGFGRSGSTLLAYLLGQLDGYVIAGEVKFVWQNGVKDNELCGCGAPFSECPFWQEVGQAAFGGWDAVDVDEVLALQSRATSVRSIFALLARRKPSPAFARLASLLRLLYEAILDVSGGQVVVDTSKTPVEALMLASASGIDCRLIHLVRDSRGVAFSWAKTGIRLPQIVNREAVMLDYSPLYIAPRWLYGNLFFELLRTAAPTARLRYEDLACAPEEHLERALRRCGVLDRDAEISIPNSGSVELGTLHTIGGNPMRFARGPAPINPDEAWRRELPGGARRAVTAVTWPLLLGYGYLGSRSRDPAPAGPAS
jgi:hypothetical protein